MEWLTGTEIAKRIRDGEISCTDVLEFFIQRVEKMDNKETNLVVRKFYDMARRRAKVADAAIRRGELWGPLHGVPMTVKECLNVAGVHSTAGWPKMKDYIADKNATPIQKVIDAGAIIFGKTNMPMRGDDIQSYNEIYGTSSNPWDTSKTCGGSSGGGAGAVAMGFTPLEIGSDIGQGSVRIPAHFCGICSHKPSQGIISKLGHVPPQPFYEVTDDLFVVGPMARCCDDLELMVKVMTGPEETHAPAFEITLPAPKFRLQMEGAVNNLKVAVWINEDTCPVEQCIQDAIMKAAGSLEKAGATVVYDIRKPVNFREALNVFWGCVNFSLAPANSRGSFGDWVKNGDLRVKLRRKWANWFAETGFDVLLCPVASCLAFPHDHSSPMENRKFQVNGKDLPYMKLFEWSSLPIIADLPATVVPIGLDSKSGLPCGVQIVAPFMHDLTSIEVGKMLEMHHVKFTPPPRASNSKL